MSHQDRRDPLPADYQFPTSGYSMERLNRWYMDPDKQTLDTIRLNRPKQFVPSVEDKELGIFIRFVRSYDVKADKDPARHWHCFSQPCDVCGGLVYSYGVGNVMVRQRHLLCCASHPLCSDTAST